MKYIIRIGNFLRMEQEQPLIGERFLEMCRQYSFQYAERNIETTIYYFIEKRLSSYERL